ncbi:unnamed protein product, partial [marine sediment metagenome]
MRMSFDEIPDVVNIALGENLSLMDENNSSGHRFNLGQDVAGNEDCFSLFFIGSYEANNLPSPQGIQAVQ